MTYDGAAIMCDAWRRFRDGQRLGLWTFRRCLETAWAAAKIRRAGAHRMQAELPARCPACKGRLFALTGVFRARSTATEATGRSRHSRETLWRLSLSGEALG